MKKLEKDAVARHIVSLEKEIYAGVTGIDAMYDLVDDVSEFGWQMLKVYCEAEPTVILFEGGYLLLIEDEIVDLGSVKKVTMSRLLWLKNKLKGFYGERVFSARLRTSTSWVLMRRLIKNKDVVLLSDELETYSNESFHCTTLKFNK